MPTKYCIRISSNYCVILCEIRRKFFCVVLGWLCAVQSRPGNKHITKCHRCVRQCVLLASILPADDVMCSAEWYRKYLTVWLPNHRNCYVYLVRHWRDCALVFWCRRSGFSYIYKRSDYLINAEHFTRWSAWMSNQHIITNYTQVRQLVGSWENG